MYIANRRLLNGYTYLQHSIATFWQILEKPIIHWHVTHIGHPKCQYIQEVAESLMGILLNDII
jgi:hypothetical protein